MAVVLHSRRVRLRPTAPRDYDYLFQLTTSEEVADLWRYRGGTPSPESFARSLWEDVLVSLVVTRPDNDAPLGYVYAYKPDMKNQTVYMAMILESVADRPLLAHDVNLLFVNHLLTCWPFRKIYGESSARSLEQFRAALGELVVEEGRFVDHEYFDGRHWDLVVTALYRDAWLKQIAEQLPRIVGPPGAARRADAS